MKKLLAIFLLFCVININADTYFWRGEKPPVPVLKAYDVARKAIGNGFICESGILLGSGKRDGWGKWNFRFSNKHGVCRYVFVDVPSGKVELGDERKDKSKYERIHNDDFKPLLKEAKAKFKAKLYCIGIFLLKDGWRFILISSDDRDIWLTINQKKEITIQKDNKKDLLNPPSSGK